MVLRIGEEPKTTKNIAQSAQHQTLELKENNLIINPRKKKQKRKYHYIRAHG